MDLTDFAKEMKRVLGTGGGMAHLKSRTEEFTGMIRALTFENLQPFVRFIDLETHQERAVLLRDVVGVLAYKKPPAKKRERKPLAEIMGRTARQVG